ncbi:MAG: PQQ-dependent sugar dehydrogenase [Marinoscillum sp.]|uniref:PQQ-dependent sugar dehydrogenase n=1 Tax=Marinoscillum sp. TaxID=2024838 RepID=UPI0032F992F8
MVIGKMSQKRLSQYSNLLLSVIFLSVISSCQSRESLLVIRATDAPTLQTAQFDSVASVEQLDEKILSQTSHLYIGAPVTNLGFDERTYIERYLEAGGLVTFSCRDTIYNWGQIKGHLEQGTARIQCDESVLAVSFPDYSKAKTKVKPGMDRLVREVLVAPLREPMALVVTENSVVYWIERKGTINMYNPGTGQSKEIDKLEVYTGEEDGLLGIVLDPNYAENHWAYVFYSPPGDEPKQHISRFCFTSEGLDRASEKVIMEIPTQRDECCHSAGDLEFDRAGNLYISTGDNTFSRASDGFTPLDERPGRSAFDSQKSSSNTMDKRGKILRIHPEKDGTYTIPDGNLFPKDAAEGLPEIYIMGARNPFTIAINGDKGWLYWGDVGPDGNVTSDRGPTAHDEINFAARPGNYGWPYFNANNLAYADYDFETGALGPRFDPTSPKNTSINNSGAVDLPPAVPAMVYYTFDETEQFPGVGKGSRSVGVGEVYDYYNTRRHGYEFPEYFHHKLFAFDWARDWIKVVSQDKEGNFLSIEPLLDQTTLASPIDMAFGPDGALYVLEYGIGYFTDNRDSKLIKLHFINGNRPPVARISSTATNGALPLKLTLSAKESSDPDDRAVLTHSWQISGPETFTLDGQIQEINLTKAGTYEVQLLTRDEQGATATDQLQVIAGNTTPQVSVQFADNQSFYWPGRPVSYEVLVTDAEDGALGQGISPDRVIVGLSKYKGSDNRAPASLAALDAESSKGLAPGLQLIQASDCKSCHKLNEKSIGPSFYQIAEKYDQDYIAIELLAKKIINGGSGVWGDGMMIGHPDFSMTAAKQIVDYIFSVNDPVEDEFESIGVKGRLSTTGMTDEHLRISASYTDDGSPGVGKLTGTIERTLSIPVRQAEQADELIDFTIVGPVENGDARFVVKSGSNPTLVYRSMDLTNIRSISVGYFFSGANSTEVPIEIELHLETPDGPMAGKTVLNPAQPDGEAGMDVDSNGMHDLYFILKSSEADYKLGINEIKFSLNPRYE